MGAEKQGIEAARAQDACIEMLLAQFQISGVAEVLESMEKQAEADGWSYRRYFREVLESEAQGRRERRIRRLLSEAQLPEGKTLASLQSEALSIENRRRLNELCEGHFVDRAENVLAFGLPGRGKTHYLSAIAHELVCRQQRRVWFTPTYKLVQRLLEAKRNLKLESLLKKLDSFEAVILDDLGYVQQSREEMEVLFTFFAERYERRSILISSNLVFSKWDAIFHDPMTAAASIDRLVHHSVILEFGGESHRTQAKMKSAQSKTRKDPQ